jgi:hypothetical protein
LAACHLAYAIASNMMGSRCCSLADNMVLTRQDMHLVADALGDQAQRLNSRANGGENQCAGC